MPRFFTFSSWLRLPACIRSSSLHRDTDRELKSMTTRKMTPK